MLHLRFAWLIILAVMASAAIALAPAAQQATREAQSAVLADALHCVPEIDDPMHRIWTLCLIARAQARAGAHDAASATLRLALRAALDSESDHRLGDVTEAIAQLGDPASADVVAGACDGESAIVHARARIIAARTARGDVHAALDQAEKIREDQIAYADALVAIVQAQARAGDIPGALRTAALVPVDTYKARSLAAVAMAQARSGEREAAPTTLLDAFALIEEKPDAPPDTRDSRPSALVDLAETQAVLGDLDGARKTVAAIGKAPWPDVAWSRIAAAQCARGDTAAALAAARQIQDPQQQAEILAKVVASLAQAGNVDAAARTTDSIKPDFWRMMALLAIAGGQVAAGKPDEAARRYDEALGLARKMEGELSKPAALLQVAMAQARAGEDAAAQKWMNRDLKGIDRAYACVGLANGMTLRRLGEAGKTVNIWNDPVPGEVDVLRAVDPDEVRELKALLARRTSRPRSPAAKLAALGEAWSFRGKLILSGAAASDADRATLILAMSPDGDALERLVQLDSGEWIESGRVSPDGRRLAFSTRAENGPAALWILENTGRRRKVADDAAVIAWSPDGSRLACYRGEFHKWENFIVDVTTGKEHPLALPGTDVVDDWSPNGDVLAVMAGNPDKVFNHPTKGTYPLRQIYRIGVDGSERRDLTTDPALDNIVARYSPDGARVVHHERKHKDGRVLHEAIVREDDGGNPREILDFNAFFAGNAQYRANGSPCWSPDGRQVIWIVPRQRTQYSTVHPELVFVSQDSGKVRRLDLYEKGIRFVAAIDWR